LALENRDIVLLEDFGFGAKIEIDQEQHYANVDVRHQEHVDRAGKHLF